jgi:hypothetical protein
MPWISQRSLNRLERDLLSALQRTERAEELLATERRRADELIAAERQAKDFLTVQLASRVVTRHGGYGLALEPSPTEPAPHPKGYVREPNEQDLARLDYYKQCYLQAGKPEEEAESLWESEMRGATPSYPFEDAEVEH